MCLEATGVCIQKLNKWAFVYTVTALWSAGIPTGNFFYLAILEQGRLGNREGKDQEKAVSSNWLQAHGVNIPVTFSQGLLSEMKRECPALFRIQMRKWLSAVHTQQNNPPGRGAEPCGRCIRQDFPPRLQSPGHLQKCLYCDISRTPAPGTFQWCSRSLFSPKNSQRLFWRQGPLLPSGGPLNLIALEVIRPFVLSLGLSLKLWGLLFASYLTSCVVLLHKQLFPVFSERLNRPRQ